MPSNSLWKHYRDPTKFGSWTRNHGHSTCRTGFLWRFGVCTVGAGDCELATLRIDDVGICPVDGVDLVPVDGDSVAWDPDRSAAIRNGNVEGQLGVAWWPLVVRG
jgi:hypothetical protein